MSPLTTPMTVKFWGVRGSIPTPTPQHIGIGGNTSCLEVRLPGGEVLIVDGGTGIRPLGDSLLEEMAGRPSELHLFLTHFHWDHIQGLPFFQPLYAAGHRVTFYSMKTPEETREILRGQMNAPYFPVGFDSLPSTHNFVDVTERIFHFSETEVGSFPLNHPQGCRGYSFSHHGKKVVFATDTEQGNPELDSILLQAARDADVLILDAQFTPDEYASRHGWGHTTWLQATEIAKQAGVKKLFLFHHDPSHTDDVMEKILSSAREHFPNTFLAIEGDTFTVE